MGLCLFSTAAWGLQGELPSGPIYENRVLIVTSQVIATATVCLQNTELYNVVVVGPATPLGPAVRTVLAVPVGSNLIPGDRFDLQTPIICSSTHISLLLLPS